jgi:glycerol-3-phosphate O-acyltransferase
MKTEELVKGYLAIREARAKILREYEEADADLEQDMKQLEAAMLEICANIDAETIKTTHGTIMRRVSERFFCSDWDNFYRFVHTNDAVQLLEKRIHQGNFRQFLADHVEDGLPPGVNVTREFGITVRKPTSK